MRLFNFLTPPSSKDKKHHQVQAEIIKSIVSCFSDDGRFKKDQNTENYESLIEDLEQTTIGYLNPDEFFEMFRYFIRNLTKNPKDDFYQKAFIWNLEEQRKRRLGIKRFIYS